MKAEAGVTGPISGSHGLPHCFAASSAAVCHLPIFLSERSPSRWTWVRSLSSGTIRHADLGRLAHDRVHGPAQREGLPERDPPGQGLGLLRERTLRRAARLSASASSQIHSEPLPSKATTVSPGFRPVDRDQVVGLVLGKRDLGGIRDGRQAVRSEVGHPQEEIGAAGPVNGGRLGPTEDLPPGAGSNRIRVPAPGWRNWQTQQTQNLPTKVVWVRSPPWAPAPLGGIMIIYRPVLEVFVTEVLVATWIITTVVAFLTARNGHIAQHRQWMIRSYAATFFFVTDRFPFLFPSFRPSSEANAVYILFLVFLAVFIPDIAFAWREMTTKRK
jgi:hypothetical protein